MAYSAEMVFLTSILLIIFSSAIAKEFIVGGESGWVLPAQANAIDNNYTTWAESYTFTVGDSLVFNYKNESHSVLQVSGTAFADCTTSDPIKSWKDGNTTVPLTTDGRMWFICGTPGHCSSGQKFKITVLAASDSAAGYALLKSSQTAVIIGSVIAGASYFF
ncbi:hypothetical protein Mapa_013167 [Marchantia paleacea]|nr:hypothetical protein Mapa_013167 [Marchantia paleacea]